MNAPRTVLAEHQVRLTIEDYLLLDRAGALADYPRTELIDGAILPVSPQYLPHGHAKMALLFRLHAALEAIGADLGIYSEVSVAMPPRSMPQPDIVLARVTSVIGPILVETVALIVEVASSTQDIDSGPKPVLYAEQGVPEYWLFDLKAGTVERHWSPGPDGYAERDRAVLGPYLQSITMPELGVATDGLVQASG